MFGSGWGQNNQQNQQNQQGQAQPGQPATGLFGQPAQPQQGNAFGSTGVSRVIVVFSLDLGPIVQQALVLQGLASRNLSRLQVYLGSRSNLSNLNSNLDLVSVYPVFFIFKS